MACGQFPMLLITPIRNLDFQPIPIKNGMWLAEHPTLLRNGRQFNLWDFQLQMKNFMQIKTPDSFANYFRDIVSGSNGDCKYYCQARKHYDYITGLGSPVTINF